MSKELCILLTQSKMFIIILYSYILTQFEALQITVVS